jgi:hypothetical protein
MVTIIVYDFVSICEILDDLVLICVFGSAFLQIGELGLLWIRVKSELVNWHYFEIGE